MSEFTTFFLGFLFNTLVAIVLVRFIYYPSTKSKPHVFTFLAFNAIIYFVLGFMKSVELGMGVGFGLFAIFSVLRYRTETMPIREMTYLFAISALPVMNSAVLTGSVWPQLILANAAILVIMLALEKEWGFRYEASRQVVYEKIELIVPQRRAELVSDLQTRMGIKIKRVAVGKVDYLHDTASLTVFYEEPYKNNWQHSTETGDDD